MTISVATFDISKNRTGWAVGTPGIADGTAKAGWGIFEPSPGQHKEIRDMGRWAEHLGELHDRHKFSHFVWEDMFLDGSQLNPALTAAQRRMEGILMAFCDANNIHGSPVNINSWRSTVYGSAKCPPQYRVNGRAEEGYWKDVAIRWAVGRGYLVQYHDEAEALAILDWALTMLDASFAARITPLFRRNELDAMHKRGLHAEE